MAWLLVQTVDETSKDFFLNLRLPKRGDVLHIHDERDSWAPGFIDPAKHKLIEVPGDAREFADYLKATPFDERLGFIPQTVQARRQRLDLDAIGPVSDRARIAKSDILLKSVQVAEVSDPAILLPETPVEERI